MEELLLFVIYKECVKNKAKLSSPMARADIIFFTNVFKNIEWIKELVQKIQNSFRNVQTINI